MTPALSRPAPVFLLGALLGGAVVWIATPPTLDDAPSSASAPASVAITDWPWQKSLSPPALAVSSANAAISAWLAMPSDSGAPAALRDRINALRVLLVRLPAESYPRLLSALAPRSSPDERRLCQIAFDAWLELDPASAARWAATRGKDVFDLGRQAMRAWADSDPAAASSWALALPDPATRQEFSKVALSILAARNPALVHQLLVSCDQSDRARLVDAVFAILAKTDPAAALRTFGSAVWKNGTNFSNLRQHLSTWAKTDPSAAVAWVLSQPRPNDDQVGSWMAGLLSENPNRTEIANAIIHAPGLPDREKAASALLFQWSFQDSAGAVAWIDSLDAPALRARLLAEGSKNFSLDRPHNALPFALALPEGAERATRIGWIVSSWAKVDPAAALAWIRVTNDPDVSATAGTVQASILGDIARTEPATAIAEWAALSDPAVQSTAVKSIAAAWARTDPEAALKWATSEQTRKTLGRDSGFHPDLLYAWSRKDPDAALRWAEDRMKAAPAAPSAGQDYLSALGGADTRQANRAATAELYVKIQDPALRSRHLARHVRDWLAQDPAAARAWVASSAALSSDQRAQILAAAQH